MRDTGRRKQRRRHVGLYLWGTSVAIVERTLRSVHDQPMATYRRARTVAWTPELHLYLCGCDDTRRGVRDLLLHFCRQMGVSGGSAIVLRICAALFACPAEPAPTPCVTPACCASIAYTAAAQRCCQRGGSLTGSRQHRRRLRHRRRRPPPPPPPPPCRPCPASSSSSSAARAACRARTCRRR